MSPILAVSVVLAGLLGPWPGLDASNAESALHAARAASCGAHSGNTARICRPGSHKRCLDAAGRGVAGFSVDICERRQAACDRCLQLLHGCFESIGRPQSKGVTCETCVTRMSDCFGRHYPK